MGKQPRGRRVGCPGSELDVRWLSQDCAAQRALRSRTEGEDAPRIGGDLRLLPAGGEDPRKVRVLSVSQPLRTEPSARPHCPPAGPLLGKGPVSLQAAQGLSPVSPQPQLPLPLWAKLLGTAALASREDPTGPCGAKPACSDELWGHRRRRHGEQAGSGQRLAFGEAGSRSRGRLCGPAHGAPSPQPSVKVMAPVQHPGPPPSVSPSRVPCKLSSPAPLGPWDAHPPRILPLACGANSLPATRGLGAEHVYSPCFIFRVPDALASGPTPVWASR